MSDINLGVEKNIDLLIAGKFAEVEKPLDSNSPLAQKVYQLAQKSIERARENLRRTVDYSITMNQGISDVARMSRYIKDVNNQSQNISASMEELSSSVRAISSSAEQASGEVNEVAERAETGIIAATKAQKSMEEIAASVHDAAGRVQALSKTSEEIGNIVKEIEDIAKQTNLLALNATIEAARAGEAGRGFAVVASEVKNLANQTATSTDTIRSRIENLRSEMTGIVTAMESGESRVSEGREVIAASTNEMNNISTQVDSVNAHMSEINIILEQQVTAADEVAEGSGIILEKSEQNLSSIAHITEIFDKTEKPIAESIDYYVAQSGVISTLMAAKSDHMVFMRKLAQMLSGAKNLQNETTIDHHNCRMGKWYDQQNDPTLTSLSEWKAILAPHKQFHEAGIRATKFYQAGDMPSAVKAVQEAETASEKVMDLLDKLVNRTWN